MASTLNGVIGKLRKGEPIPGDMVDEIERLLDVLRGEGWSGFTTADEAARVIARGEQDVVGGGAGAPDIVSEARRLLHRWLNYTGLRHRAFDSNIDPDDGEYEDGRELVRRTDSWLELAPE